MTQRTLLLLAGITALVVAVFFLVRLRGPQGTNVDVPTERVTIEGRVEEVGTAMLTVLEDAVAVRVMISADTVLRSRAGQAIALGDIRQGFTVRIEGILRDAVLEATSVTVVRSPAITILRPSTMDTVLSPFTVQGEAQSTGSEVLWSLSDDAGIVLATGTASLAAGEGYRTFRFTTEFAPAADRGVLTVREAGENGALQTIALRFSSDIEGPSVKVFFGNERKDPGALSCDVTYPVNRRMDRSADALQTALTALVGGPTEEERAKGYFTTIPVGTRLLSVAISDDGVAQADFSEELEQSAGSCAVTAIRSQITQTLLQFPSVREVVISIAGRTEEVLEP